MKVDIQKNKAYYKSYDDICRCDGCQNYVQTISEKYPQLKDYLNNIGIDIKKPFETLWIENHDDHTIHYLVVQYVVFGEWEKDTSLQFESHNIRKVTHHPMTGIKEDYFVIDIDNIILLWKLDKKFEDAFPTKRRKGLISAI